MIIDYIEIEGYKSIKHTKLDLKPINILIGSNGSGKSNFISFF
ncbi:AAA family ATPase [Tenacibaculum dicentrarchi]